VHSTLLAESYLHSIDPYLIEFSNGFGIRWYGLAYVAGFLLAWAMALQLARKGRSVIPADRVSDMMIWIIMGVLVGGRLGYVLFYDPALLVEFDTSFPWWQVLAVHRGGMASHGGMIGVILGLIFFAHRNKLPSLHLLDVGAIISTPGLFLGRIANFINGELWGEPWRGDGEAPYWTVKYPTEVLARPEEFKLEELRTTLGGDSSFQHRVVLEIQSGNEQVIAIVEPQLTAYYPSQLIQAISDGPVLLLLLIIAWWRPRKPGVIAGCFLVFYGCLRIITEFFRQPDEGIALVMGLSRGQQLSLVQVVLGLALVAWCASRRTRPICGLGPPASARSIS